MEIGAFAPAREGQGSGEPLYLQKHRIRTGAQTIAVSVPSRPDRAGIDPYQLLIDWETDDNIEKVKADQGAAPLEIPARG